jgi:CRP/FNR family nitrogen fixation transcriptional regulator
MFDAPTVFPKQACPSRPADDREALAGAGVRMSFARGEEIYAQAEEADLIYEVLSGAVRTSRLLSDGRRQIGDFYYSGDLLGLEVSAEHRFSAEALIDSVVLVARRERLSSTLGTEPAHRLEVQALAAELTRVQNHLSVLGCKTACERVASFLLDAADRNHTDRVDLPMGRQDIADFLGLTIETVSRMVSQLQVAGVVEFKTCRTFTIRNRSALMRLSA